MTDYCCDVGLLDCVPLTIVRYFLSNLLEIIFCCKKRFSCCVNVFLRLEADSFIDYRIFSSQGFMQQSNCRGTHFSPFCDQDTHSALVGTTAGDLFEIFIGTLRSFGETHPKVIRELVRSHAGAVGSVSSLAAGDGDGFATVGADGSLRLWAANRKRMVRARSTGAPAASVDCRHDGDLVAVGHVGGGLTIWETRSLRSCWSLIACSGRLVIAHSSIFSPSSICY
jgi:WD40 repeat protein